MDKVIYTDIDGVLKAEYRQTKNNPLAIAKKTKRQLGMNAFSKSAVNAYNEVIEATGAKIIVSSDWRIAKDISELKRIFFLNGIKGEIIGITPILYENPNMNPKYRAEEIMDSVKTLNPKKWVALDDLPITRYLTPPNHVKSEFLYGFTQKEQVAAAISYLR